MPGEREDVAPEEDLGRADHGLGEHDVEAEASAEDLAVQLGRDSKTLSAIDETFGHDRGAGPDPARR